MFIASIVSLQIVSMAILVWTVSYSVTDAGWGWEGDKGAHNSIFQQYFYTFLLFL